MFVFVCTIHQPVVRDGGVGDGGVGTGSPSMYSITRKEDLVTIIVLQEMQHIVRFTSQPLAIFSLIFTCVLTFIPPHVLSYAHTMSCLMQHGTNSLVSCIRTNTHPTPIRTIGCWSFGSVVTTQMETLDTRPFIEIVDGLLDGFTTSLVGCSIRCSFIPRTCAGTLGMRHDFHFISVCHCVGFVHHVRTDIINGGRLQTLDVEDVALKVKIFGGAFVQHCRVVFCTPTYTTL